LQAQLAEIGKTLTVREEEDGDTDTLYLGLYEQAEEVEPYLTAAEVTLVFTPTVVLEDDDADAGESLDTSSTITVTVQPTSTDSLEEEAESPNTGRNRIVVTPLGEMSPATTSLLLLQSEGNREILVALANSEEGLTNTLARLAANDLTGCLMHEVEATATSLLALCPSGELAEEGEEGGWQGQEPGPLPPDETESGAEPEPEEPPTEPVGSIIIVSLDEGVGRYDSMTSAQDYTEILQESYEVSIWSVAEAGLPSLDDLILFDLSIWTMGDYEEGLGIEASDLLFNLMFEGVPVVLSGAYISDSASELVQRDIQVNDASHPLARGFEVGEVIEFVMPPSGSEYEMAVLDEWTEEDGDIVFVRGPNSEASEVPSVVAIVDDFSDFRLVYVCFPVYLLPEGPKEQFVRNTLSWLLNP
jgi:hypothetical protein